MILALWLAACATPPGDGNADTDAGETGTAVTATVPTITGDGAALPVVHPDWVASWPFVAAVGDRVYVSWSEADPDAADTPAGTPNDVFVAVSTDGGETFGQAVQVDDETTRGYFGSVRKPALAANGDTVALSFVQGTITTEKVVLYLAGPDLDFGEPIYLDVADEQHTRVDQPTLAFAPDGELWVSWKVAFPTTYEIAYAHENEGWTQHILPKDLASGFPCECCPIAILFNANGDLRLSFRNNDRDIRDIFETVLPAGGDTWAPATEVSHTHWLVQGCPLDGPKIALGGDGTQFSTWVDSASGDTRARWSRSTDGGLTWGSDAIAFPNADYSETLPTLVASTSGRVFLTVEELWTKTLLTTTTDGGDTWIEQDLASPNGPLLNVETATDGGKTWAVGTAPDDSMWLVSLE